MKRGVKRNPAKTSRGLFAPTAGASGVMQTRGKRVETVRSALPHNWRDGVPTWKITAMLAKVGQDQYLDEVRAFELFHIAEGTESSDWGEMWRLWCRDRLMAQGRVSVDESPGLFGSL